MITSFISDIDPSTLTGFCTKTVVTAIDTSVVPGGSSSGITMCYDEPCCDKILALAGGDEDWQNDKASFIYGAAYDNGGGVIINMYLQKDNVDIHELDSESPLGIHYPLGTWNNVTAQKLYSGFEIEWALVLQMFGYGNYSVRAEILIGENEPLEELSECYEVREYNCSLADNSVYFEWVQNGETKFGAFDFTGMNWRQYRRVKGKFAQWKPTIEKDSVLYSNYYEKQVQDSVPNKYVFESELLMYPTTKKLIEDVMLADDIYITDYNTFNHRNDYLSFPVRQDEIELNEQPGSKKAQLNLTFTDRFKNFIKNS